jgi:DNA invertase Pin-like site-specific DNA recombinase
MKILHLPRRWLLRKLVVFANGTATRLHNIFMLIGYARVSKIDQQDTRAQVKALREAGCKRIYEESASGGRWDRPELHRGLDQLREGDILVVRKLDRLSRSLKDLLNILEKINDAGAGFRSLTENIDTTSPAGRMMLQMIGAFAEFERSMIRERTRMELQAARERGRIGGRKPQLKPNQRAEIIGMVKSGSKSAAEAARLFNLHRSTISRLLAMERLI